MAQKSQGSLEIEQTLRLARDAVERDIARYRMGVFASVVVVTSVLHLAGLADTWAPTLIFSVALVYAIVVRSYLNRRGNPPALALVSLFTDLSLGVTSFLVVGHYGSEASRQSNSTFAAYIVGPSMVLMLLINSLRNSTTTALAGSFFALVLYLGAIPVIAGFHPGQVSVTLIVGLAGVIGTVAARQARMNLDSFARLQLLRRYLQPEAVERIMRSDPDSALALGGRLVTVTLLAADLRGFTAMSEMLSPSEVMAELNAYHGVMIDVIDRHGGAIDKFIGDGTLVVFGLVGSAEAAASSAVACAVEMVEALGAHNQERVRAGAKPLAMGIGVHTGPVIAGNLGVPGRRLEFTVIGDAVNTVSRLEGQTKTMGSPVIVSAETAALLPNPHVLRELSPVSLRGKEKALRVFGLSGTPTMPPPDA
jgi:class 3 adenylate cyclase